MTEPGSAWQDAPLIFERSRPGRRAGRVPGYGLPVPELSAELRRARPPRLPELAEPELVRHITTLADRTFGVDTGFIPDWLALVGDSADGYPGIAGIGAKGAARLINAHGRIEDFPDSALSGERRRLALLFKQLATLRTDAPLFSDADSLRWRGPDASFAAIAERMNDARVLARAQSALESQ